MFKPYQIPKNFLKSDKYEGSPGGTFNLGVFEFGSISNDGVCLLPPKKFFHLVSKSGN